MIVYVNQDKTTIFYNKTQEEIKQFNLIEMDLETAKVEIENKALEAMQKLSESETNQQLQIYRLQEEKLNIEKEILKVFIEIADKIELSPESKTIIDTYRDINNQLEAL